MKDGLIERPHIVGAFCFIMLSKRTLPTPRIIADQPMRPTTTPARLRYRRSHHRLLATTRTSVTLDDQMTTTPMRLSAPRPSAQSDRANRSSMERDESRRDEEHGIPQEQSNERPSQLKPWRRRSSGTVFFKNLTSACARG